jgi:membrane protein implicated in regulation of membrane protease activity
MIASLYDTIGPWSWLILGLCLLAVEILVPGIFFLWFGLAAIAVGVLALAVSIAWQIQIVLFLAGSCLAVLVGRALTRRGDKPVTEAFLNRRAERFVGRTFTLDEAIVDGEGRLKHGDTIWRVAGPDAAAGSRVEVTGVDGPRLLVRIVPAP